VEVIGNNSHEVVGQLSACRVNSHRLPNFPSD